MFLFQVPGTMMWIIFTTNTVKKLKHKHSIHSVKWKVDSKCRSRVKITHFQLEHNLFCTVVIVLYSYCLYPSGAYRHISWVFQGALPCRQTFSDFRCNFFSPAQCTRHLFLQLYWPCHKSSWNWTLCPEVQEVNLDQPGHSNAPLRDKL